MNKRSCVGNTRLSYLNGGGKLELFNIQKIRRNPKEYPLQICQHLWKFTTVLSLIYIRKMQPTWYVRFTICIWRNNVLKNNTILITDIYFSITFSLIQLIYIRCRWKNIQRSILANTDFNNISIDNYKREILQIFISAFFVFVTSSLPLVYLEVISKIYIISSG